MLFYFLEPFKTWITSTLEWVSYLHFLKPSTPKSSLFREGLYFMCFSLSPKHPSHIYLEWVSTTCSSLSPSNWIISICKHFYTLETTNIPIFILQAKGNQQPHLRHSTKPAQDAYLVQQLKYPNPLCSLAVLALFEGRAEISANRVRFLSLDPT